MAEYRVTRTLANDLRLVFTWEGGTYIDVALEGQHPTEVIHVWNHEEDKPTISFTKPAMRAHVDEWISEYPRKELIRDVIQNW